MEQFLGFLNPIARLGNKKYSYLLPFFVIISTCILSELFAYGVARNPNIVGAYIIFITVSLTMYFAFRDGIRGGVIVSVITIAYYGYIIYTRHYKGEQFFSGVETTAILAVLYFLLAGTIGWLKQTIDSLIEREANEKRRLQAIIQQLPVGVLITNNNGVLIQRNKQLDTILGMKIPLGFKIGEDTLDDAKINGKAINPSQSPLSHALSTGKTIVGKEYTFQRSDGKRVFLQVSSSPVHNRAGKIIAAASIVSDITGQKELEKRKDDFVNMASHELKTPITSMKLYIDSLMKRLKSSDERSVKTLQSIKYQAERLQELVSDLLDVSRLQTGKLSFTKEDFRLDTLIEETIDGLSEVTKQQKIHYLGKVPLKVHADKFRIYQVLTNLLTNAIKYSPEGKSINVKVKRVDGKAVVSVEDFGIGISKEQKKKIFDRLYQVTDDKEKTFPGLGLGLYISKEIVTRHRGSIWVESEKDKGSTFFFSLPLK